MSRRISLVLCIISAVLLILIFPNFEFSYLAWFAFVPLLFALRDKNPHQAFFFGYVTGLIFYLGSVYWLIHVTLPGLIFLCLYLALYFGFFSLFATVRYPESRARIFILPAIWVALEYLRTSFATGFGWSLLGYSQYKNLPVIQIADITGPYGVSFLIMMVNVIIYQSLLAIKNRAAVKITIHDLRYTVYGLILLLLTLSYGYSSLARGSKGDTIRISTIQGNISQHQKWNEAYEDFILDQYSIITTVASVADNPDLIVWPETAFPGYYGSEKELTGKMGKLIKDIKIPMLFGTPLIRTSPRAVQITNSAILLDDKGKIMQQYDKLHLVPFGEYVPFEKVLGFVHNLAPYPIAGFAPGSEYTVFKLPNEHQFSVLICFEDIFPSLSRRFVREGADFLVTITNDAWFKRSSAPYQHAQASVFRAVENRVNMVRSANTGLSCFIDTKGKITSRVTDMKGEDIFVEGFDTQNLQIAPSNSIYTKYGDLFAYICMLISLIAVFAKKSYTRGRFTLL